MTVFRVVFRTMTIVGGGSSAGFPDSAARMRRGVRNKRGGRRERREAEPVGRVPRPVGQSRTMCTWNEKRLVRKILFKFITNEQGIAMDLENRSLAEYYISGAAGTIPFAMPLTAPTVIECTPELNNLLERES